MIELDLTELNRHRTLSYPQATDVMCQLCSKRWILEFRRTNNVHPRGSEEAFSAERCVSSRDIFAPLVSKERVMEFAMETPAAHCSVSPRTTGGHWLGWQAL